MTDLWPQIHYWLMVVVEFVYDNAQKIVALCKIVSSVAGLFAVRGMIRRHYRRKLIDGQGITYSLASLIDQAMDDANITHGCDRCCHA